MRKYYWYAVMKDENDNDWGFGSYNKRQAAKIVRSFRKEGYPNAYIAVIDVMGGDEICVDEIYDIRGL